MANNKVSIGIAADKLPEFDISRLKVYENVDEADKPRSEEEVNEIVADSVAAGLSIPPLTSEDVENAVYTVNPSDEQEGDKEVDIEDKEGDTFAIKEVDPKDVEPAIGTEPQIRG